MPATPTTALIEIARPAGGSVFSVLGISADGQTVLVQGTGLTADDADPNADLYSWNAATGAFQLIGAEIAGGFLGTSVGPAVFSPDGRYIAFVTDAQLSPDDTRTVLDDENQPKSAADIYLYDTQTGTITLVTPPNAGGSLINSVGLKFSEDSSILVIQTDGELTPDDEDGAGTDVYTYAIAAQQLSLTTAAGDGFVVLGGILTGGFDNPVSADGRFLAMESNDQLTSDDDNAFRDVYLYDGQTGTTVLLSDPVAGGLEGQSSFQDMSADGGKVLIWSTAQLSSADTDGGLADVYLWDSATGSVTLLGAPLAGGAEGAAVSFGSISDDGGLVVFSTAAQLVAEDTDSEDDVYLYRVGTGETELLSATIPGGLEGDSYGQISGDGTAVLINGWAQLTPDDTDAFRDAYFLDLTSGEITLASADVPNGTSQDYAGRSPDLDTRVLWLSPTFGENFYRWDAATESTIPIPRESTVPIFFDFSRNGSAVAFTDSPSGISYWFGLVPASGVTVHGGKGKDSINGTAGADFLYGGHGADTLRGHGGDDHLFGGKHKDILIGGAGDDTLSGGSGKDVFLFKPGFGDDTIVDFGQHGGDRDRIDLSALDTSFAELDIVYTSGGALITSSDFAGSIFLVDIASLGAKDFVF